MIERLRRESQQNDDLISLVSRNSDVEARLRRESQENDQLYHWFLQRVQHLWAMKHNILLDHQKFVFLGAWYVFSKRKMKLMLVLATQVEFWLKV